MGECVCNVRDVKVMVCMRRGVLPVPACVYGDVWEGRCGVQVLLDVGKWVERKYVFPEMLVDVPAVKDDGELAMDTRTAMKRAFFECEAAQPQEDFEKNVCRVLGVYTRAEDVLEFIKAMRTDQDGQMVDEAIVKKVAHNRVVQANMVGVKDVSDVFTLERIAWVMKVCRSSVYVCVCVCMCVYADVM